ncbi:MAG: DUF1801 domain-containing protein [Candidatus Gracilibacteria bacterium]|nr:DUF1801 domain-containing protein [Candidatus Gracilibacteria bacterium]
MATLKTQENDNNIFDFLNTITDEKIKSDGLKLVKLIEEVTKKPAKMWGEKMIGFGKYHYKYESGHEGDWFLTGLAPKKKDITIYIMPGFMDYDDILKNLGKYKKTGSSCMSIKKLEDINIEELKKLIDKSVNYMIEKWK